MTAKPMDEYSMIIGGRRVMTTHRAAVKLFFCFTPMKVIADRPGASDEILGRAFMEFRYSDIYYQDMDYKQNPELDYNCGWDIKL